MNHLSSWNLTRACFLERSVSVTTRSASLDRPIETEVSNRGNSFPANGPAKKRNTANSLLPEFKVYTSLAFVETNTCLIDIIDHSSTL